MSTLKAWRQVVTPHADIRQGKFDASVFAADLGEVLAGRGAVDYRDAQTFFSKTYLTYGLTHCSLTSCVDSAEREGRSLSSSYKRTSVVARRTRCSRCIT